MVIDRSQFILKNPISTHDQEDRQARPVLSTTRSFRSSGPPGVNSPHRSIRINLTTKPVPFKKQAATGISLNSQLSTKVADLLDATGLRDLLQAHEIGLKIDPADLRIIQKCLDKNTVPLAPRMKSYFMSSSGLNYESWLGPLENRSINLSFKDLMDISRICDRYLPAIKNLIAKLEQAALENGLPDTSTAKLNKLLEKLEAARGKAFIQWAFNMMQMGPTSLLRGMFASPSLASEDNYGQNADGEAQTDQGQDVLDDIKARETARLNLRERLRQLRATRS